MKVYGKRNSSIVLYASQSDPPEVELSDYESEPDVTLESDLKSSAGELLERHGASAKVIGNSTDGQLRSVSGCKANSTLCSSFDSSSANLEAFDFLDHTEQPRKRRKTHHQKQLDVVADGENADIVDANPLDKTIHDLNKFLSSLKGVNETSLQDTFKEGLKKSLEHKSPENLGKLTYDRSRTILLSKDEEGSLEAEDDETKLPLEQKDEGRTYHINELKNMGDILKYQDDLELLFEGSPDKMVLPQFISNLLSIALTMNCDDDFCRYVNKRQVAEMWQWFFCQTDLHNPVLILVQGFLSNKIHLPSHELPNFFQKFVVALYSSSELPNGRTVGNKIAQLNYDDFLHSTQHKTGQEYALQLCLQYPVILSSTELVRKIVEKFQKERRFPEQTFPVIEQIISSGFVPREDSCVSTLFETLLDLLPTYSTNDNLVKCLILLTNERTMPQGKLAFKLSMDFILDHLFLPLTEFTDILILHLGLCLNVIEGFEELSMEDSQWTRACGLLSKLLHSHEIDTFLLNMFCLNFAYMTVSLRKQLPLRTKTSLVENLNSFAREAQNYNKSIPDKIDYVSHKL